MDINQQQHLANFAPKPSLDKYSKGADPRVISGIVALSEMQEQAAMRQRANLASGAASGQMPTVRDKIMSLFQQSNPQQAQAQPNPTQQGIAARAHPNLQTAQLPTKMPQEAPQEAPFEAYAGGVARLPVRDDMFGYADGGIIAFNSRGSVPKADDELPSDEAEGSRKRMKQRTDMTPESMAISDLDFMSLPELEKSEVLARAMANIPQERKAEAAVTSERAPERATRTNVREEHRLPNVGGNIPTSLKPGIAGVYQGEPQAYTEPRPDSKIDSGIKKALAFASAPFAAAADVASLPINALRRLVRNPLDDSAKASLTPVSDYRSEYLQSDVAPTSTTEPAPTGKPQLQKPRIIVDEKAAAEQARLAALHDKFKAGETLPTPPGIKSLPAAKPPGAKPPGAKPPVTGAPTKETAPAQDQELDLMGLMAKQFGPQPAVATTEERLAARDKYIEKAPTAPEALALLKHYDNMAKRYAANDQEEKAQQAINARNNLWTFLTNTRGSSLGVAAGSANAALQPLLSAQETRRQSYQKQRDEQEMLLGKARYEIANAERARKEGRYSDAEKSELEAKKLQEQARGHNIQGIGSLVKAAGDREDRRLGREQQYLMHTERMSQLKLDRERMQAEATERRESQDRTQRENAYGRQSAKLKEAIQKAQKMLDLPDLPKDMKQRAEVALERLQKEDNDLYERIVVRGDKDYRPSPTVPGGNSALTSKADKIVGVK